MIMKHFFPIVLAAASLALPAEGVAKNKTARAYFDQDGDGHATWHTVKVKDFRGNDRHNHHDHRSGASFSAHYSRPYYSGSYCSPYYSSYSRPYYSGSYFGSSYPYSYPYTYGYPYTSGYPRTSIGVSLSRPLYYNSSRSIYRGYTYSDDLAVDVQHALKRRGYYYGAIDGDVGPGTRGAIRAYQRDRGLSITGRIDTSLLRSLGIG